MASCSLTPRTTPRSRAPAPAQRPWACARRREDEVPRTKSSRPPAWPAGPPRAAAPASWTPFLLLRLASHATLLIVHGGHKALVWGGRFSILCSPWPPSMLAACRRLLTSKHHLVTSSRLLSTMPRGSPAKAKAAAAAKAPSFPPEVEEAKELISELCRNLYSQGHVSGTGGGISIKPHPDYIVMAPSGVQKERMQPDDMFVLDAKGDVVYTPAAKPPPARPPKLSECSPLFMAVSTRSGALEHIAALRVGQLPIGMGAGAPSERVIIAPATRGSNASGSCVLPDPPASAGVRAAQRRRCDAQPQHERLPGQHPRPGLQRVPHHALRDDQGACHLVAARAS